MANSTYDIIMSGKSDNNIRYADFQNLILSLGFVFKRQSGSHTMYYHEGIKERLNIQKDGAKAKGYQVRQLRDIIVRYNLEV